MTKESDCSCDCKNVVVKHKHHGHGGNSDAIYGLGVIGAIYYFLEHAQGLSEILWGIGKAIFWPAILMYKLLTFLKI
jgi:Gpi18-like mannosyltransferase